MLCIVATKATTTEAGYANWPAEAGPDDSSATEPASANRTTSEAADRSASETAATDAAAKAGADRSTKTTTTTTYRPAPKAATDRTPAETATHPTATEPAAHPATVEATAPTATHSSTAALGRSHVGKESGRDQRCRTEKTKLNHGRLLDSRFVNASLEITLSPSTVNRV